MPPSLPPRSGDRTTSRTLVIVVALVAVTAALRLPLLAVPFERDEGEYAYIGWRLAYGELPYRDWVDQKPPAIFWVYRLALALPLESTVAVHLVAALFSAVTAVVLWMVARRFTSDGWAAVGAVTFALLSADPVMQGTAANTELFMLLPLLLSQLAFFRAAADASAPTRWIVLCGALTGVAMAFKQVAAVQGLLLVALWPLFVARDGRERGVVAFSAWFAGGVAAIWAPIALYFFVHDGLGALIHEVFTHNFAYASALPWSLRVGALLSALVSLSASQILVWGAAAIGLVTLAFAGRRRELAFLGGGLVAGAVGVSASGYFFPHYFQQILPPLAIAAAIGAERWSGASVLHGVSPGLRSALAGLALVALPAVSIAPFLFVLSPAQAVGRIYPTNHFAEMPAIAARLAATTRPEDRVFVFGAEPQVLFHARRVSASRYIHLFPLYGPYPDALAKQRAVADEITQSRPAAILWMPNNLFSLPGSEQWLTRWVEAHLQHEYRPDAVLSVDPGGGTELRVSTDGRPVEVPFGRESAGALHLRATD